MLDQWSAKWHTTISLALGRRKSAAQKKKEEVKLKMAHLAKKRKKEAADKAQAEHEAV